MIKKVGFILILMIATIVSSWYFVGMSVDENDEHSNTTRISSPTNDDKIKDPKNAEERIGVISALALRGKVPHISIVAGETKIQDVYKQWGEPDKTAQTPQGHYDSYEDKNVTIGYQNDLIFDVRSYHPGLQNIHLNKIKQMNGKPDDVRYYQDETHDQKILVYKISENYQLKWIFPNGQDNPVVDHISVVTTPLDTKNSVSKMVEQMSLDEKIGQMIIAGISGTTMNAKAKSLISKYKIGGIIFYTKNLTTPKQSIQLVNQIKMENQDNALPLILSVDQEGGEVSRLPGNLVKFPSNNKIGEINNPTFSYKVGQLLGKELNAFGLNMDFAPVLDVNSNPNNPVIGDRSFGNDPEVVSELGIQTMKGIQSQHIISVIKHFPGHGDTSVDSHLKLPKVNKSLNDLKELELIPFKYAISAGADVVMLAHILLPKLDSSNPSSMSKKIITGILRKQLNFTGVVMTDDMTMKAIMNNFDIGQAAVKSVKAGSDIILVAHDYDNVLTTINALKKEVEQGKISVDRIDQSVARIIKLKQKYKINDDEIQAVDIDKLNLAIEKVLHAYN